ncbi:MarR family winged helix-turn-helix transcriptional regulator [Brucella inopinata]|uniref:MarR family transcriptional regulator n=1 Tax=Brucella inopinata TaxID=1218315 RepID=A0AAW7B7B0_9HYPH|nr:MarR family transcriptional regulator [Brucella inopinata]EFM55210.1 MarR family transcriptional regulator [Brucella inopinata BO1]KEY04759.1 MarR family transcriptional regulator [Brucella suis bv. 4 str. 40]MDL2332782.1 MarR family transcriptional regulator [Brucella inopinata]
MMHKKPDTNLDLADMLCFAVYSTANALSRAYQPILAPLDLTYPQFLVMLVLWERDDCTVSEIGARLNLDSGTLTPLLKRLEAAGRITRRRDPRDERQVRITLTDDGRKLREQAESVPEQIMCATGQPVSELQDLRSRLMKIRNHLTVDGKK